MRVRDVMRREPRTCTPGSSLAQAGRTMHEAGCGFLPMIGDGDRVVGVITDRDLALAVSERDRKPSEIEVRLVASGEVWSCRVDDDLQAAMGVMRDRRVRRLPVVDQDGRLQGILSLDDIVLEAHVTRSDTFDGPLYSDVGRTLEEVNRHPVPALAS